MITSTLGAARRAAAAAEAVELLQDVRGVRTAACMPGPRVF
jgi:hypothetical protein